MMSISGLLYFIINFNNFYLAIFGNFSLTNILNIEVIGVFGSSMASKNFFKSHPNKYREINIDSKLTSQGFMKSLFKNPENYLYQHRKSSKNSYNNCYLNTGNL